MIITAKHDPLQNITVYQVSPTDNQSAYEECGRWMQNHDWSHYHENWPHTYFVFADSASEEEFVQQWGSYMEVPEEEPIDLSWMIDLRKPREPSGLEAMIEKILQEAIDQEILKEVRAKVEAAKKESEKPVDSSGDLP